jgi:hypothetical protein
VRRGQSFVRGAAAEHPRDEFRFSLLNGMQQAFRILHLPESGVPAAAPSAQDLGQSSAFAAIARGIHW